MSNIADEIKEHMLGVIWGLRRGTCWCEMAVDNPMTSTHDKACIAAAWAVHESENEKQRAFADSILKEAGEWKEIPVKKRFVNNGKEYVIEEA